MQRDFQNKTVVITGACRGIGAGIAERFARDGANLVMVSNAERVQQTAETLRQRYQADILSLQVDVTDEAQVQSLYRAGRRPLRHHRRLHSERRGDHHRLLRPDAKSRFRKSAGGQHHRRVAVLPRGGQIYGETESRQPDQHLFRPGATGVYLHAALRRQQNGRDRRYPKPGARAGTVEHHRQRLLPRHH